MDAFIDKLEVSKELKAWMKKNHWVQLSGEDFIHKLKPADIMDVPEFYEAYVSRMSGDRHGEFPEAEVQARRQAERSGEVRKAASRIQGSRAPLHRASARKRSTASTWSWRRSIPARNGTSSKQSARRKFSAACSNLAQSKYLVARTQTNLDGEGFLSRIPPGNYWLSTLDVAADVGDARPRWDVSLPVRPGQETRVALSNVNALPSLDFHSLAML